MKMSGSQIITAPRDIVWNALNDPELLQKCIPGCESIIATSPTQMNAKVVLKIGPVKASFTGAITLSDVKAPESYRISGKGEGGIAGFASGGATVKLTSNSATATLMEYDVDAQVGGKIAMLGARLVDSTAQSLANQFFDKFATLVKARNVTPKTKALKPVKKTPNKAKAEKTTKSKVAKAKKR